MKKIGTWLEHVSDALLFLLVTLPVATILLMSFLCSGWNEGSMTGTCSVAGLDSVYNVAMGSLLLLAFGGFILVAPVILIAFCISVVTKISKYAHGYRPSGAFETAMEVFYSVPLFLVCYAVWAIFFRW